MRARLKGDSLIENKILISTNAISNNNIHYGSRIEFDREGHLFVTIGDRNERPRVQDLLYHNGKTLRLNLDGSVPKDNPYVNDKKALPEIWSLGHRSPQGLAIHPVSQALYLAEMGPRGGDELNIIKPKLNYGWPVVTYGREYSGFKVGDGITTQKGMEDPLVHWVPSISPSAITFYTGDKFPNWKNNLFVGCLSGMHLRRLVLDGDKVMVQEELLKDLSERFRNLRTGPDGYLYFSTDNGLIARIVFK